MGIFLVFSAFDAAISVKNDHKLSVFLDFNDADFKICLFGIRH